MSSRCAGPSRPRPCTSCSKVGSKPSPSLPSGTRATARKNRDCSSPRVSIDAATYFTFDRAGAFGFDAQFLKLGYLLIPLDEGRDAAVAAQRQAIKVPHRRADRPSVRIKEVGALVAMSGEMNLANALCWQSCQVLCRVEAVVGGADVDIVDIEQDAAVGLLGDLCQKGPLRHGRMREGQIARHILEQDLPAKPVLHGPHPLGDMLKRLFGVRQRQQVVGVMSADAAPAEMIRDPSRLEAVYQGLQIAQISIIERIG